jgi:hypothetical protein
VLSGERITDEGKFCPHCGKSKSSGSVAGGSIANDGGGAAVATAQKTDTEKIFLSAPGAKVTNSRIILANKTYAMAGLTSVKSTVIPAKRGWAILTAVCGLILAIAGGDPRALGIVLLIVGVIWALSLKDKYAVTINSASGELYAPISKDEWYIDDVVSAINEAIVYRS